MAITFDRHDDNGTVLEVTPQWLRENGALPTVYVYQDETYIGILDENENGFYFVFVNGGSMSLKQQVDFLIELRKIL